MNNYTTVVGLDVHKETIVAAILPYGHKDVTEKVSIENHPKAIEKLVNRVQGKAQQSSYMKRDLAATRYSGKSRD